MQAAAITRRGKFAPNWPGFRPRIIFSVHLAIRGAGMVRPDVSAGLVARPAALDLAIAPTFFPLMFALLLSPAPHCTARH
jgi:hypothetical protein